jgi:glycolate oxidase
VQTQTGAQEGLDKQEKTAVAPIPQALLEELRAIVGAANCIHEPSQLRTYESDGLATFRATPGVVVLPGSTEEVSRVVKAAAKHKLPIVPRGAGTGLSGGALPVPGCMVVGLSRMRQILEVDLENGFLRVQPGVINLDVSKLLSPKGYYYAPDPSSQSVCTIGGNVAENSGGAHCLKYGFTVNHVLGLRIVLHDGAVVDLGGPTLDAPGYDLVGVVVGSEGMLGIVTEVWLKALRKPEATRTFFATFPSTREAGDAVSAIIASGIVPAAIEMMDTLASSPPRPQPDSTGRRSARRCSWTWTARSTRWSTRRSTPASSRARPAASSCGCPRTSTSGS